jgi:hypothetical protein
MIGGDYINMLQRLQYYESRIKELQTKIQEKLDAMEITDSNEDLYTSREERIDALEEIADGLNGVIGLIEDYTSQWSGLKNIK